MGTDAADRSSGAERDEALARVAVGVLDSLLEGCQVIGFDFTYLYVNDAVVGQGRLPRESLLGHTMMECYPGIERTPLFDVLRACMTERRHDRMENEFQHLDGTKGWFELRFIPVPQGVCILSLDVTAKKRSLEDLRRTEEQLRQSQKMEAVGRLAGGIAHDFNNLLSVILAYTRMTLDGLDPADPMVADLEEVARAGERASDLTRQLLLFSRQQVIEPKVIDLNQVLAGMAKMLQRILGADIDFVSLPSMDLGRVLVDPSAVEVVIMNLVVNARDAMPTGGKLTIETANAELDEAYASAHLGVTPGPHVMLSVTDTGAGMTKETAARIFEPFFTTKETGKGTGLGLSTVFGIVQQAGGSVWVYSEPAHGTTFKVYFPRVEGDADAVQTAMAPELYRGTETILLVEDDGPVRGVARAILERAGYSVIEARDAADAMARVEQHDGPIDVLLSDVVMPGVSGPELARRIAATRPGLRVLLMSGYTDDSVVRHGVLTAEVAYLQKPITPMSLTRKIRLVLDSAVPAWPR